jgi:hypothetical protein
MTVQAELLSQFSSVRVAGSPAVGHVLRAVLGNWVAGKLVDGPWAEGTTVTYQWARNGVPIPGATRASYVPGTSDLNKGLTVRAMGTKPGSLFQSHVSDWTSRVYIAYIKPTGPVLISGSLTTGSLLSASQDAWDVPGVTLFRHWMRNGIDIAGWDGGQDEYRLTAEDLGAKISVRTVAGKYSYRNSVPVVSAETGVITKGPILSSKAPAITGTAKVGWVLSTTAGIWNLPGLTVKYQWYAGGVAVPGATSKTYTPAVAQAGKTLKVKVNVSRSGYLPASVYSAGTAAVAR